MGWSPGPSSQSVLGVQNLYAGNPINGQSGSGSGEVDIVGSYTTPATLNTGEVSAYINGSLGLEGFDCFQDATGCKLFLGNISSEIQAAIRILRTGPSNAKDSLGFFGTPPIAQPAAVGAPSGGTTIDTQARAAIVSLINLLSEAAGGLGLTA